jgi:hypothetical protein
MWDGCRVRAQRYSGTAQSSASKNTDVESIEDRHQRPTPSFAQQNHIALFTSLLDDALILSGACATRRAPHRAVSKW